MNLPDHSPQKFQIYVEWLYEQSADIGGLVRAFLGYEVAKGAELENNNEQAAVTTLMLLLWVFGDYLGDGVFKNKVMDDLMKISPCLTYVSVNQVFELTRSGCKIQKMVVDIFANNVEIGTIEVDWERLNDQFKRELMKKLVENRNKGRKACMSNLKATDYHESN